VADTMGKSAEATRALQHRALLSLRRILLDDFAADDELPDRWTPGRGSSDHHRSNGS
jgi:hypothetical protein